MLKFYFLLKKIWLRIFFEKLTTVPPPPSTFDGPGHQAQNACRPQKYDLYGAGRLAAFGQPANIKLCFDTEENKLI